MAVVKPTAWLDGEEHPAEQETECHAGIHHPAGSLQRVVEGLGPQRGGGGEDAPGLLLLVKPYLGHELPGPLYVVCQDALDEVVHGVVDELEFSLAHPLGQFRAARFVPDEAALLRQGEDTEHLAVVEHRDDLYLLVRLADGLPRLLRQ